MKDDPSTGAPSDPGPEQTPPDAPPRVRYTRQGLIGRGGMGEVYAAQDARLRRLVALKVAATPQLAGRLAREAWITAQLEHPNIVAVYDAGETDGQAWYTMRMIRGRTLRERLGDCADLAARLELLPHLHAACQAVAYAHSMGIVHRDLKPANIMVGAFGETQVADWGLAMPLVEAEADWARVVAVGTPRYMSPEAKEGAPPARTVDVYALGAALWELLAGVPPPDGPLDGAALPAEVPPELVAIVRCAVHPDPAQRYPDAEQLAADLGQWLAGGRVRAHEYRPIELLVRLVRAWRAPLTVAAVALGIGAVASGLGVRRLAQERAVTRAHLAEALAAAARTALVDERLPEAHQLAAYTLGFGPSPEARGVLAATGPRGVQRLSVTELPEVCRRLGVVSPDGTRIACASGNEVGLWDLATMRQTAAIPVVVARTPVWMGTELVLPGGAEVVWVRADRERVRVPTESWPVLASERQAFGVRGPYAVALSPDGGVTPFSICAASPVALGVVGSRLVVGCNDGWVRQWDAAGALVAETRLPEPPAWTAVVPGPEGTVWVGGVDGVVAGVGLESGQVHGALKGAAVRALVAVPGTPVLLVLGERGGPRLWNTAAGGWAGSLPTGASRMFPGTAPGEVLLLGDTLERWRIPAQPQPHVFSFTTGVSQVSPSPDGSALAVALGEGVVEVRRRVDGVGLRRWALGSGVAKVVAYAGPDRLLAGVMSGPGSWLVGADAVEPVAQIGIVKRAGGLSGGRAWALGYTGQVWVRGADGTIGPDVQLSMGVDGSSSPSGDTAVVLDSAGKLTRLAGAAWVSAGEALDAVAVDIGDGGHPLVVARMRSVCVDGRCHALPDDVVDVALHGDRLAVGLLGGDVRVLDVATGETRAVLRGHTARVSSVEFGPGGDWLVSGSWDATVRVWDLGALDAPAAEVAARGEAAWGLGLEAVRRGW